MSDLNTPWGGHASGSTGGMRPIDPHAQMAYDNAKRLRQASQDHAQKQRDDYARNRQYRQASGSLPGATVPKSDPLTLNDYLALASIGGFVVLLVLIWNAIVGQFHPGNPILAAIVNHGVWAVGFAGFHLGIALKKYLMKVGKLIILLAMLFFGSAVVYGLYQGFTGAG